MRRAALDPVHVERGLGERPQVELLGRARIHRSRALLRELVGARRQLGPTRELLVVGRYRPAPERLHEPAVLRDQPGDQHRQSMRSIQGAAAVHARVQVCVAGPQLQVEVDHPARRQVERRQPAPDHAAVEDDCRVRPTLVRDEVVDDRVAAGLLLAVAAEPDVHGQLAGSRELARRREQHVELSLVVDRPAAEQVLPTDLRLERLALPQLERRGRLNVEMAVAEHRRRLRAAGRGGDLSDRERLPLPVDDLRRPTCSSDEVGNPAGSAGRIGIVRRVGAHRGDAQELGELVEPRGGHRARSLELNGWFSQSV